MATVIRRRQEDWESRLRYRPSAEAVRRLLASHGHEAVEARWGGWKASELIRSAPEIRGAKGRPRTRAVEV